MLSAFDKKDSRGGITVSVLEAPGLISFYSSVSGINYEITSVQGKNM